MVKIHELLRSGSSKLKNSNTPQLDAEVILSFVLKCDRIRLYMDAHKELGESTEAQYLKLMDRRSAGEPVAYIIGSKEFMGLDFAVGTGVLIPRGDTELLVTEAVKRLESVRKPSIIDVGCGSGAIAVSVAYLLTEASVLALDKMPEPLFYSRKNAEKNGVSARVQVIESDLFSAVDQSLQHSFDAILSNPPYIEEEELDRLMVDVRDYEPAMALKGGIDGLDFYRRITVDAAKFLKSGGLLAYEIGWNQRAAVEELLRGNGFEDVCCIKDLAGFDRVVSGCLKK